MDTPTRSPRIAIRGFAASPIKGEAKGTIKGTIDLPTGPREARPEDRLRAGRG
jgi:hypothetical protein